MDNIDVVTTDTANTKSQTENIPKFKGNIVSREFYSAVFFKKLLKNRLSWLSKNLKKKENRVTFSIYRLY
jgi:hypothetical protein